jgi:tetratricopeptide (TPR) repeat protein
MEDIHKKIEELSEKIDSDPENNELLVERASLYQKTSEHIKASIEYDKCHKRTNNSLYLFLSLYNKTLQKHKANPDILDYYEKLAVVTSIMGRTTDSIKYIENAIEKFPNNSDLHGSLTKMYLTKIHPDNNPETEESDLIKIKESALVNINIAINLDPSDLSFYYFRGLCWMLFAQYRKAIDDFNKCQPPNDKLDDKEAEKTLPGISYLFTFADNIPDSQRNFLIGLCLSYLGETDDALSYFLSVPKKEEKRSIYPLLQLITLEEEPLNSSEFRNLIKNLVIKGPVEFMITLLEWSGQYRNSELAELSKQIDSMTSNETVSDDNKDLLNLIFKDYPMFNTNENLMFLLKRDGKDLFIFRVKKFVLRYLFDKSAKELFQIENLVWTVDDEDEIDEDTTYYATSGEVEDYKKRSELIKFITEIYFFVESLLSRKEAEIIEHQKLQIAEERNRVISNLSHSIKNLISSVIDPLESIRENNEFQPQVVKNALRGTNLIREMVNAMNLSFVGSIDDFYFDIRNNDRKNALSLNSILIQAIKYSIPHMFDGKYFSSFVHGYFPEKSIFLEAKSDWDRISETIQLSEITLFLNNHFFLLETEINEIDNLTIGNKKGSAIKLLIMIQELVFNAVKYSSYVDKEDRYIKIFFYVKDNMILFEIRNKYKPQSNVKSSGMGNIIVKNFCALLNGSLKVCENNEEYTVKIEFENYWSKLL